MTPQGVLLLEGAVLAHPEAGCALRLAAHTKDRDNVPLSEVAMKLGFSWDFAGSGFRPFRASMGNPGYQEGFDLGVRLFNKAREIR